MSAGQYGAKARTMIRLSSDSLRLVVIFSLLVALVFSSLAFGESGPQRRVSILTPQGEIIFQAELALTPDDHARGLMGREHLGDHEAMLFIFQDPSERQFWMHNTPLSLDILFLNDKGCIHRIAARTTPYSRELIPSKGPAQYVLEIRGGLSDRYQIQAGQCFQFE
jgi:uncharacterized membrane protein (UPF0127 family)